MKTFDDELRNSYRGLDYDAVEEQLERGKAAQITVSRASEVSPVTKVPLEAQALLQVGLRRNMELTASFVESFNAELFAPLFLTGRAVLETACLLWEFWARTDRIVKEQDKAALDDFEDRITKALLGVKSPACGGDPENYPAPNVLTIIDRLNKREFPRLRWFYDTLSEFAHPNYFGMHAAYGRVDDSAQEIRYVDRPFGKDVKLLAMAIDAIAAGLLMTVSAVEKYEKDLLPFTRLCEEAIHDGGTWPSDVPYPGI
ncbi:hypothetical protein HQ563_14465 [bacterium]|nr:hypothetical protein [bacterium]